MLEWTPQDTYFLRRYFGRKPINWLAVRLHRTPNAIWCRANKLNLLSSGKTHNLSDLIRDTGYNWKQLLKAKTELNQNWERHKNKKGSKYYITEEQKEELLRHLAKPGPKFSNSIILWESILRIKRCLQCGVEDEEHYSLGLCKSCFDVLYNDKYRLKLHELLIIYWKIAQKLNTPVNTVHPLNQLNLWISLNNIEIHTLRINLTTR